MEIYINNRIYSVIYILFSQLILILHFEELARATILIQGTNRGERWLKLSFWPGQSLKRLAVLVLAEFVCTKHMKFQNQARLCLAVFDFEARIMLSICLTF